MMEEEKIGTAVYDGKIYNIDNMSNEELEKLEEKMQVEQEKIRAEIDKILEMNEEEIVEDDEQILY